MTSSNPSLRVLYINPADGCNLHCKHCWVNEGSTSGEILTLEQWKLLLMQAKELGCSYIKLTGGEPLLYRDIVPLYRFISEVFHQVVIETNGTLEPEGLWDALLETKPYHISVSLDSADPISHDSFRGQSGSWEKTVSFAKKLVAHGINSQVIMSVSSIHRKSIEDMIYLVQQIGIFSLKINFVIPSGRGKNNSFIQNTSIKEAVDFFAWFGNNTPAWVQPSIPAALLPVNRLSVMGYCPVQNLMGVLPDGTFSLCGVAFSRKDMSWGKFPETSVEEAWKNSPIYNRIRSSVPEHFEGVCHLCMHRDSCLGSCVVNNLETGGSITSPDVICQQAYDAGLFPTTRLIDR